MKKFIVRGDIPKDPALIIKNQLLLSPGVWNGKKFTADQIKRGMSLTNWADSQRRSIIYGHRVDGDASPDEWLGYHTVPEYRESDGLSLEGMYADLYIYDEGLARKIAYGGAKAGVSERVKYRDTFNEIEIEGFYNLSIVDNPACRVAYLNLSHEGDVHTVEIMSPSFINLSDEESDKNNSKDISGDINSSNSRGSEVDELSNSRTSSNMDNTDISNLSSSSSDNQREDAKDDTLSSERRLSKAKTEENNVMTENLSDLNNKMENEKQNKQDVTDKVNDSDKNNSIVDTKYQELESKISELQKQIENIAKPQDTTVTTANTVTNNGDTNNSVSNREPNLNPDLKPNLSPDLKPVEITASNSLNKEVIDAIKEMNDNMVKVMKPIDNPVPNPQTVARTNPNFNVSSSDDEVITKLVKQYEALHNIQNE